MSKKPLRRSDILDKIDVILDKLIDIEFDVRDDNKIGESELDELDKEFKELVELNSQFNFNRRKK